jgi:hypothetical protein
MQKEFKRAVQRASLETSRYMSASLRKEAKASGWPSHVVNSLKMSYGRDGFDVRVHDDYVAEAMNHEFGTTEQQPSPAVRRTLNRMESSETFFLQRASKHLGV